MFAWAQGGQSAEGCACEVGLVVRYGAQHAPPSADPTPLCMKAPISALGPRQIYPTRPLLAPNLLKLKVSGRGSVGWLAWSAQAPNWNQAYFWQPPSPASLVRLGAWEVFAAIFACPLFINWKS